MKQITKEQRYQIEAYLKANKSKDFIAHQLSIHRSNIFREIKRNSQKRGNYNAQYAQLLCDERKERLKRSRTFDKSKQDLVRNLIEKEQWSPQQIVGYCKRKGLAMVSHESIYQYIRADKENAGKLYTHLRHRLKHRKRPVGCKQNTIKNRVSIDERPSIINNKERFGDWEIDTIIGKNHKRAIVTIVERTTSFFMMKKLQRGKNADALAKTVIDMMMPYKNSMHSITSDNGKEFAEHEKISKALNVSFYFAHPYSSWERGLNEYTNKLVRQYIPKKTDFNMFDDAYLTDIQHKLNRRPRDKLKFETPKNLFFNFVN